MASFDVPIVFLVFNRPDATRRVFEEIRRVRPRTLLLVADGPRNDKVGEVALCGKVRDLIEQVDWPCHVLKNYSDVNLGCKQRVSTGLDWVFNLVEEAIILEDDCLPHPTFFKFCSELLEKYRDDERVAIISGDNFQFDMARSPASYYFSRYPHIWGWATWRRVWQLYDVNMSAWPDMQNTGFLHKILSRTNVVKFWEKTFAATYAGKVDTWDHQLTFACIANDKLCIMPKHNLVTNIGFGQGATHTKQFNRLANIPLEAMEFPLHHPSRVIRDDVADERTENEQFSERGLLYKALGAFSRVFHAM